MNRRNVFVGSLLGTVSFALLAQPASALKLGPFPDFKGFVFESKKVTLETFLGVDLRKFGLCFKCGIKDSRDFTIKIPVPVFASTYIDIKVTLGNVDPNSQVVLTDVWSLDLNPSGNPDDVPLQTGFNAIDPQIVPLSDELFIGRKTGTIYTSFLNVTSTLADLPTLLPGYDLSVFTGDPNSIVYVSQALVPAFDVGECIPEPSTVLSLLALGTLGAASTLKRQLKPSKSTEKETTKVG